MNRHNILFPFNSAEKLIIELKEPLSEVHCCYDADLVLVDNGHKTLLSTNSVKDNLDILTLLLSRALDNKLELHHSITKDIGYLYNEYCDFLWNNKSKEKLHFVYEKLESSEHWIGNNYTLWGYDSLTSWLYVNSQGSIIFEITPAYPGGFGDPEKQATAIPYEQWIQSYEPYFIRTITRDTAQQWLEQANHLLKQIEKNIERESALRKKNESE